MGIMSSLAVLLIYFYVIRHSLTKGYVIWSILLVSYFSIVLSSIVGFPTLSEFHRMHELGESYYHPEINWHPLSYGIDVADRLNILLFIPLGIALPVMWRRFNKLIPTLITGLGFSVFIEVSQLFTFYRRTDINDLIMNTLGVFIGWLLIHLILKWRVERIQGNNNDLLYYFSAAVISCFLLG